MLKKSVTFLFVLLVVVGSSMAYGQNDSIEVVTNPITPQYSYIHRLINIFDIEGGGKSTINAYVTANGGTSISLEVQLQRLQNGSWTTTKSWQQSSNGTSALIAESWYVTSGYYYRTIATAKVYVNGVLVEQDSEISKSIWW